MNYIYIIKESNFEKNIDSSEFIIKGTNNIVNYTNNDIYKSRVLEYIIKMDKELETQCQVENCQFCLKDNRSLSIR